MNRRLLPALLFLSIPFAAHAAPPHVHGVALLDIAVDGNTLSLHLDSPLVNLVGFEHPAYNPAQKKALDEMVARLNRPEMLFVTPAAAGCKPGKPELVSAALETKTHNAGNGHADMDADFSFQCSQPQNLTGIEVKLIEAFPHTHKVKVQVAGPKGESAVVLEAGHTHVGL